MLAPRKLTFTTELLSDTVKPMSVSDLSARLGYQIHTNRELGLMLQGIKPLAFFYAVYEQFPEVLARYLKMFDRHVADGRFVRRDYVVLSPRVRGVHYVYFARPQEDWRIDAMIELNRYMADWNLERERAFGSLLGYAEWQNDAWIAHVQANYSDERWVR
jgi:hypothetical protein